ncbi:hypothetical protein ACN4DJ_05810 [Corynebacterium macclintockiae]|uniref:hypothetical protein n=1 Tax=Corynebacterium macclintockiae TaxID=2913501 RepID=UPI003EBA0F9D
MAVEITVEDIHIFNKDIPREQVEILIRDGMALAARVAPCINESDFQYPDAAAAIIRGAILRWAESGAGGITQQQASAGPFALNSSFDTRSTRRSLFFPSEITELQELCKTNVGGAFGVDTIPTKAPGCVLGRDCTYLCGSVNSPCPACGETLQPGWWGH